MTGRASAFAVLGLEPGAGTAAIEQAYKRLIKQHHPDREGGDVSRAAEITKAYRELRGGRAQRDPLQFNDYFDNRRSRRRWPIAALFAAAGIAAAVMVVGPSVPLTRSLWAASAQLPVHHALVTAPLHEPMNEQLHIRAIDEAVRNALHTFRTSDEMALASASRECERRFRDHPGTGLLDRCAAFDDAVVGLEDRDPLRDEGPFAPLAVTGRQWSAASSLSDDDLAIDDRLDQVRLRVNLTLTRELTTPVPAAN
jgi:curved DNA-binding protein CbpA